MERLVEEYSDTEVFQNFESISVDTDLICLDADHTNYSILIQLAKKGVNVLCQGLWNVENYLGVIREFKRNNKFVIEDESFLNFEKVSIFVDIAKKLLAFDPAAEIEIKTNCFNIYAAVRILGMFLPNMQQMTVEQHVEQDSKEWVWCRLRNKIVVFEIDKKIYYGIYVCKIEIYEKGLKYGWEEVEYLWKGKLESPLVLDYIINNIKNWDKLIQKEQQATLLLFEQGEDIYAHALYKETKILQYLNHSLSKKVLGYLHENANATILEIGAGTGATSNKVLSDIRENKFEEHIVYFYTDISRFFLQRAKERYKECDGKIEMHHQTLDIDEAFSSQLPSNFQADIVIAVGVLNNSVNTDKCIYEINSVMKPGGILLVIETVEDVPDILITQSFMMTAPKDRRKATNTMFLNRKQWLEILEENGFCNSEEFPGYGEYLEVLGQKLFYCTKE